MRLILKLVSCSQGPIIALLISVVFSACSPSSTPPLENRSTAGRAETAESKEVEELAIKIEGYQKQIDADGNMTTLPGFETTALQRDDGVLSAKDIATNPEAEIFSYEPPSQVDADFSMPEKITGSYLKLIPLDVTETCKGKEYLPEPPRLKELPLESGFYFICIRLTHRSSQKQFYIKTPPIEVSVVKTQFKFVSEDCVDPDLTKLMAGIEVTLCNGSLGKGIYVPPVDCSADGQTGCVNAGNYKSADTSAFSASDILSGTTVAGIAGSAAAASIANCTADGQTSCVTTSAYKSADTAGFVAGDVKTGKTVAGVAGSLADCSLDGATGCVATATYKAAKMADFDAAKIRSGTTIAGVGGSIADCSTNGQDACFLNTANS